MRIHFDLSEPLSQQLRERAARDGLNDVSSLVEEAVGAWLVRQRREDRRRAAGLLGVLPEDEANALGDAATSARAGFVPRS